MSDTFDHDAEAWDSLLFCDDDAGAHPQYRPACRSCGQTAVTWRLTGAGWRLVSTGTGMLHRCANPFAKYAQS